MIITPLNVGVVNDLLTAIPLLAQQFRTANYKVIDTTQIRWIKDQGMESIAWLVIRRVRKKS